MSGLKVIGGALACLATVVGVWALLYYGGVISNNVQANYNKRVVTAQVQQSVRTKEFAQAAYEQFFKDCNDVVAMNGQLEAAKLRIEALKGLPDDVYGTKAQKVADAISDETGLEQGQQAVAARYNANAAEYTRGQFLDQNLPARLDPPYNYQCQ